MAEAKLCLKIWTGDKRKRLPADDSDLAELFAPHLEHVASMCEEGYQAGEIIDERFSGWWSIERSGDENLTSEDSFIWDVAGELGRPDLTHNGDFQEFCGNMHGDATAEQAAETWQREHG